MLDVAERLREFVDGAEAPVTTSDVEAVLAKRSNRRALLSGPDRWRRTTGVLVTSTVVLIAVVVGLIVIPSSSPVKIPIPTSTPVSLNVPSTPKLTIKLPKDAVEGYRVDWVKAPSLIPLYRGTSLIGYVTKASVEHPPLIAAPAIRQLPVPAGPSEGPSCDLVSPDSPGVVKVFSKAHILVGWIFPTSGFVRVGDGQPCGS